MGVESKIAIDGEEKVKKERNISRGAKEWSKLAIWKCKPLTDWLSIMMSHTFLDIYTTFLLIQIVKKSVTSFIDDSQDKSKQKVNFAACMFDLVLQCQTKMFLVAMFASFVTI